MYIIIMHGNQEGKDLRFVGLEIGFPTHSLTIYSFFFLLFRNTIPILFYYCSVVPGSSPALYPLHSFDKF